jgi:hypothetical protein
MSRYIHFGTFRVREDHITDIQETIDIEGTPCVMLYYAKNACVLLYDKAAAAAREWSSTNLDVAHHRSDTMPRNIFATSASPPVQQGPTREQREKALSDTTLENIGIPDDLVRVEIKELHDINHYRINIYREVKGTTRITDSYYVTMTNDGIVTSPPMMKKYYDVELASLSKSL